MKLLLPGVNAFVIDFDPALLLPLQHAFQKDLRPRLISAEQESLLSGVYYQSEQMGDYYVLSYDTYPLLWLTNHNLKTYTLFQNFFKGLALDALLKGNIDFAKKLVMYSGFFVVGNRAVEEMWHYDYRDGAQAYTLITPLFDWRPEHGHLLYKHNEKKQTYAYKKGQAIVLGDGFLHSTQPYPKSKDLRVLVSFTFGSDRWKHWPQIKKNIAEQSYYYHQPCGHAVNTCGCENSLFQRIWGKKSLG